MKPRRALGLLGCIVAVHGCGQRFVDMSQMDRGNTDLVSISVTLTGPDSAGTVQTPLPFSAANAGVAFTAHIAALGADGNPLADFNGYLAVSTNTGELVSLTGMNGTVVGGRNVQLSAGEGDVAITITRAIGETRIWAEDQGYVPADPNSLVLPQCSDSDDNDHDGRIDFPADYGCAAPNDDSETGGSYVLGSSGPIVFDTPLLSQVQGHATVSPLLDDRVLVNHGRLIVTAVNVSGFYVTDVADPMCIGRANCYNSIFLFNFSLPAGIRPCDRLSQLEGTVTEFVGTTQMGNPSWVADPDGVWIDPVTSMACPIPAAEVITPATLASAPLMEALESGIVRAPNALFPMNIGPALATQAGGVWQFTPGQSNCDFTNDGAIDFHDAREGPCADACQTQTGCSEWTNWVRFGQISVDFGTGLASGTVRLVVSPKAALPNFDPASPPVPATTQVTITGTLSQVGPNWIVTPRCADDIALNNVPLDANASCISPRTDEEDNP